MLNIEMLMEELEDETKMRPPPERKREVERILDDHDPNVLVELANAPEDIQERIKELDRKKRPPKPDKVRTDDIRSGFSMMKKKKFGNGFTKKQICIT